MRRHRWTARQVHAAAVRQGDTVLRLKMTPMLPETDDPPHDWRAVKRIVHADGRVCLVGYGNSRREWWTGVAAWLTQQGAAIDVEVLDRRRVAR